MFFWFASATLVAGTNGWTNVSPPGGAIHSIVFDTQDPSLVFASMLGVFRSSDAGRSWEELSSPTAPRYVRRLVVSPTQSGVVYAVNWRRGINISTDRGDTWSFFAFSDSPVTSLAVDRGNGSRLYAVVEGTLYRSTDRGTTWQRKGQELGFASAVAVGPTDGSVLVSSRLGTHRSTNRGSSWVKISDQTFDDFMFHPRKPEIVFGFLGESVFKSTDRGQTWVHKYDSSRGLPSFAISPDAPNEIYAGTLNFEGVSRSTDEGETWAQWNTGLSNLHVNAVAARPGDPNVVLAAMDGAGVFRREEGATAWASSTGGIRRPYVSGIAFDEPGNRIYISTFGGGVFRSSLNGGFEWSPLNQGLPNPLVQRLTIDPHNPSILYASIFAERLYRTTDAGQHWEAANNGLQPGRIGGFLAPDPQIPGHLLLTGGHPPNLNLLYESTDYGASWTQVATPLPGYTFTGPIIDSQSGSTYLITLDGLYRTQNPAGSWEKLTEEKLWRLLVDPTAPDRLFAATQDTRVVRSTDGGKNWETVSPAGTSFSRLEFSDGTPPHLLALGASGLFLSSNAGDTWNRLTGSPSADSSDLGAIGEFGLLPSSSGRLFVGLYAPGGLFTLDKTDSLFFPLLTAADGRTTGLALTNHRSEPLQLSLTAFRPAVDDGSATALLNIPPEGQKVVLAQELFGFEPVGGWVRADQTNDIAAGLASVFSADLSALDALPAQSGTSDRLVFPEIDASARVFLGNPNDADANVLFHLLTKDGTSKGEPVRKTVGPTGLLTMRVADLFPGIEGTDYIYVSSDLPLFGAEEIGRVGHYVAALSAQDPAGASARADLPHFGWGAGLVPTITLVNVDTAPGVVTVRLLGTDYGARDWTVRLPAAGKAIFDFSNLVKLNPDEMVSGYLKIESEDIKFIGSVRFSDPAAVRFGTTLPIQQVPSRAWVLPQLVSTSDFFTSLAVLNPGTEAAQLTLQVRGSDGSIVAEEQRELQAGERLSKLLTELFPSLAGQELNSGSIRILSDRDLTCIGLFGSYDLNALSAIPANVMP